MTAEEDARKLNVEGQARQASNDLVGAEACYRSAIATSPPGSLVAAIAHDNLGSLLDAQGRLHDGIGEHLTALGILAGHPEATLDLAITANNIGLAYLNVGNRRQARFYLELAKHEHDQYGQLTDHYLGTLLNLAILDGWDDAELGLSEVNSMLDGCVYFEQTLGRRSEFANQAVSVRGQFLVRTGDLATAEPLLEQAIEYYTKLNGATSSNALAARASRAELLLKRNDPQAEAQLLGVLADQVATDLLEPAEATRDSLAAFYFVTGRAGEQAQMLEANVGSEERRTAGLLLEASQDEALDAATFEVRQLGRLLSVLDTQHGTNPALVGSALEHWLRRKAMTRDVLRRSAALERSGQDPAVEAELGTLRDQLDEDVRIATEGFVRPNDEWVQRQARIKTSRARITELERQLGRQQVLTGLAILRSDIVGSLPAALGPATVLIEMCALAAHRTSEPDAAQETWTHGYAAFVVTGAGAPAYRWLGSTDQIESLVAATLTQIGSGARPRGISGAPAQGGPTMFDDAVSDGLEDLSAVLLELIPPGAERLVISADGQLGALPLQLLPLGTPDAGQWLDRFEISYLLSGADLVADEPPATTSPGPALVVAAPQYSSSGLTAPFAALRAAEKEGNAVAAELGVTALIGPAATKEAVLAAGRPVAVHLATHAFFGEPSSVAITMATMTPAASATDAQPVTMADLSLADPDDLRRQLVRAGLALAGANDAEVAKRKAVGDPHHDLDYGLLLAIDVLDLDLTATELVVLSACDTGRGRAIVAQGLWGLPLALQVAGARRTVSSLWPVDDDSTCELMTAFYRAIVSGQRPAAALQAAARLVRQTHPEPRYWAPFVMIGDQQPIVGLTAAAIGKT